MSEQVETHKEVIAEMRESVAFNRRSPSEMDPHFRVFIGGELVVARQSVADRLENFADRIEAAHKRDVENLNSVIQAQRSAFDAEQDRQRRELVGNAAKMREAIVKCVNLIVEYGNAEIIKTPLDVIVDIEAILKSALAAPARNCDVGTAEEQADDKGV